MSPGDNGRSLVAVLLSLRLVLARVFFGFGAVSAGFADSLSGVSTDSKSSVNMWLSGAMVDDSCWVGREFN